MLQKLRALKPNQGMFLSLHLFHLTIVQKHYKFIVLTMMDLQNILLLNYLKDALRDLNLIYICLYSRQ